jgi:hypothetical protein
VTAAIDILIRTYFRDFRWLSLCLRAISAHVEGHRDIVVVMPPSSLERLPRDHAAFGRSVRILTCGEYADDYLGQQITKLTADAFTDADHVAIVDSDCICHAPCSLQTLLFEGGRPVMRYRGRSRRPESDGWRACIADFHGASTPFDPVTASPWLYPANLFAELRATACRRHHMSIDDWVLGRSLDRVSEISLLAGQAWLHRREDFVWRDQPVCGPFQAYWSRSPHADATLTALAAEA